MVVDRKGEKPESPKKRDFVNKESIKRGDQLAKKGKEARPPGGRQLKRGGKKKPHLGVRGTLRWGTGRWGPSVLHEDRKKSE